MANKAIVAEHVFKQYRLGVVSTGTLSHDLNRWWYRIRGKEDPYEKITGDNKRDTKDEHEYVWALQDINFEVGPGEVLGIIGKNGAGKSTLLKLLSKVTGPTKGHIKINGRAASLLEVGTGFHPELTGRENIFLNGAILGMTKVEIRSKLDEIIQFSGVEKYIDTPVKRYSSGMYVRLAFAVAAHLEPEILIVDEVLAVGDAEFQKKAIGKMKEVSESGGRTVLFVSHNMLAIKSLCTKGIWMEDGKIKKTGNVDTIINSYLAKTKQQSVSYVSIEKESEGFEVHSIKISDNGINGTFDITKDLIFEISVSSKKHFQSININLFFKTVEGTVIFATSSAKEEFTPGKFTYTCTVPGNTLNDNSYNIDLMVVNYGPHILLHLTDLINIEGIEPKRENTAWLEKYPGLIRPTYFQWKKLKTDE